ncbi:MAG: peptidoglycan-binding domain-containing protein [Aestuariivirgaceae bacterium]
MHDNYAQDTDRGTTSRLRRALCGISIALVSGAIIQNAVFGQQERVFSQSRVSISSDAGKLDKLFSVLTQSRPAGQPGHTRVKVQPEQPSARDTGPTANAQVLKAQRELARIGEYSGRIDGVLGDRTRMAIRRYQRSNGLSDTGQPDQKFFEHLDYVRRIQAASTITGSTARAVDRSAIVRVQIALQRLGYDPGPVDGKKGIKTSQAIRSYQADMRLPVDGELSPFIVERLASALSSARNQ